MTLFPKFSFDADGAAIPAIPAIPEPANSENSNGPERVPVQPNSENSRNSNGVGTESGVPELLEHALTAACRIHGLDAAEIKAQLVEAADWPDMDADAVRVYAAAVARSRLPGTRDELRELIRQWARIAGLANAQRQELLDACESMAPAFIGENVEYFRRRIHQATAAIPAIPATLATVRCRDCRHFQPDTINPEQGLGACAARDGLAQGEPPPYPHAQRRCNSFEGGADDE